MKALWRKIRFSFYKWNFDSHRLGAFWCNKHWEVIRRSLNDIKPINPALAAANISMALWLKNVDPEIVRVRGGACCIVANLDIDNKRILEGIFERSRKEWN